MKAWAASTLAIEIWKRSFISQMAWPTVRTNLSRKRSFSKTLFKPEEFENAGFSFWRGRKTFGKRLHDNRVISLTEFSSKTNSK